MKKKKLTKEEFRRRIIASRQYRRWRKGLKNRIPPPVGV